MLMVTEVTKDLVQGNGFFLYGFWYDTDGDWSENTVTSLHHLYMQMTLFCQCINIIVIAAHTCKTVRMGSIQITCQYTSQTILLQKYIPAYDSIKNIST